MQQGKEFWGKLQNSFSLALIKIASVEKEHTGFHIPITTKPQECDQQIQPLQAATIVKTK